MTKHNGTELVQAIDMPERAFHIGDTRLMRAAMNLFLLKRGVNKSDFNQHYVLSRGTGVSPVVSDGASSPSSSLNSPRVVQVNRREMSRFKKSA